MVLCLLTIGCAQDDAGGADGEEGAVFDDATLALFDFHVVDEGAGVAVVVGQGIAQLSALVAADVDSAVVEVDAGVNGLEGGVDGVAFLVAADNVVAHLQGNDLLVVEHVLDDDDGTEVYLTFLLLRGRF